MDKVKIIFAISFLVFTNSYSQISEIVWQQCFGDAESNYYATVERTENGYLFAIGINSGENVTNYHGSSDIWLLMTDSSYNMIWEKCYGGSDTDNPRKILKTNSTGYFIFGSTASTDGDVQSGNNGFNDMWVLKINDLGDIIWENTYGCTGYDDLRDMILTPDGGFVMIDRIGIGGGDVTDFYGSGDVWMCKCDSLGNIEWEKTLGNEGLDNCVSMIINNENNIMMIGATQKQGGLVECYPDEAWGDVWLVELDLQGNIISQHCYGGSDYELGYSLQELENGYAFIASTYSNDGDVSGLHGPTGGPPGGWGDIWVVKLNEQFEIIWQKCIGGYDEDSPNYITQTNQAGLFITGTTNSNDGDVSGNHSMPESYNTDIWAVKLDSLGEIEWQQCYGGWGSERLENPHTILKKDDCNYIIASSTNYSPSDDVQCGSISGVERDAWIFEIDIEDTTSIYDNYITQGSIKAYPNPAKDYVVFELNPQSPKYNEIIIKNIFDQQVERLTIKSNKTIWDTRNIQSSIYIYTIYNNESSKQGKILITK